MADPLVIICTPTRPGHRPEPGSTTSRCSRCKRHVWLDPTSLEKLALVEPTPAIVCTPCLEQGPRLRVVVPTAAVALIAEIAARRREEVRPAD